MFLVAKTMWNRNRSRLRIHNRYSARKGKVATIYGIGITTYQLIFELLSMEFT